MTAEAVLRATFAWGSGLGILVVLAGAVEEGSHTAVAIVGVAGVVGAMIPGIVGRVAAVLALALGCAALILEPSWATLAVALVVAGSVVAGRAAAAAFATARRVGRRVSNRLERESVLLDERADAELARARRHNRPLSVVRLSPGDGHLHTGGAVDTAGRLTERLRLTDAVGVTGNSDVTVLLPDTPGDVMPALLKRLRDAVDDSDRLRVGWASFPEDALTWDTLTAAADARAEPSRGRAALSLGRARIPLIEHDVVE